MMGIPDCSFFASEGFSPMYFYIQKITQYTSNEKEQLDLIFGEDEDLTDSQDVVE
jgi:hypothetical protein